MLGCYAVSRGTRLLEQARVQHKGANPQRVKVSARSTVALKSVCRPSLNFSGSCNAAAKMRPHRTSRPFIELVCGNRD